MLSLCLFGIVVAFVDGLKYYLLFILFPTVHRKTNFVVNLYWDNKYSDSVSDDLLSRCFLEKYCAVIEMMRG